MFQHIHSKLIMTLEKELVEPSSGGSFDRFSFNVRLKPSFGGSKICTITPYAAFIASMAPDGSPPKKMASAGGVGNDTDSNKMYGFFIDTCNIFLTLRCKNSKLMFHITKLPYSNKQLWHKPWIQDPICQSRVLSNPGEASKSTTHPKPPTTRLHR